MEQCAQCGKQGDADVIRRCSGCQMTYYCSRQCQRRHWSRHKADCLQAKDKSLHVAPESDKKEQRTDVKLREGTEDRVKESQDKSDGPLTTCHKCGIERDKMKTCGVCLEVTYCSRDCQRADWRTHKVTCQPAEVVTTEGFRQTEHREQAEQRAKKAAEERQKEALLSLLRNVRVTPHLTWEEARSRAQRLYPRQRVVVTFADLEHDGMGPPRGREGVVAVMKITGDYPHFFRHGRVLEDKNGMNSFVLFHTSSDPRPYFRYEQLREGSFLCFNRAYMHFFADGTVGFRIDNDMDVTILEA